MSVSIKSNSSGNLELYSGSTKVLTADSKTGVATFTNDIVATTPTLAHGSNNTQIANTAYVDGKMVLGTAVATTSGTSIDFTGIPSWVKRITVMFNGVSSNGTNNFVVQLGSGSITSSGYNNSYGYIGSSTASTNNSAGFGIANNSASNTLYGHMTITSASNNVYIATSVLGNSASTSVYLGGGSVSLSGVIDRVRLSTNSSDTFDAGSINIMYEG